MLKSLHISNFVLIDHLDIDFPDGLVIISGPTGAGKSILIGALGLLTGRKADAGAISENADSCVVEGEFFTPDTKLEAFCNENDIEYEGGNFTVRRTVAKSGRSRAFINDTPVSLPVLEEFGASIVDIHSQHDTLLLTSKAYQLSILDSFADNGPLLSQCAAAFAAEKELRAEIALVQSRINRAREESDYNTAVYEQLEQAKLREGELEELEQEQLQLSNAEQIKELMAGAAELFDPSDDSRSGVNNDLLSAFRNLDRLSSYIKGFDDLARRLESARLELKDISEEISMANDKLSCSPERLQQVDDRLGLIYGLMKRHKVESEAELIQKRDSLKDIVLGSEALEEQLSSLQQRHGKLKEELESIAASLHERRAAKAGEFAEHVMRNLSFMELDRAVFRIQLSECAMSSTGSDEASFLFSSSGVNPVPVAKCASGGELSRIMLSLKQLMSRFMAMPTMVFDEIDTGVSGSVADKMGSVICTMGEGMQVFAITHLPQVAAKGDAHYLVEKTIADNGASSSIKKLSDEQRVLEIARMLSGSSLSEEAVANARRLLKR
ncbi:MAG: DNA repair protein RecN [Bacteroidales bacterium]|nr:DNA repair protein RecN [Bacteroidales bacterium]